jgi:F0F1-type ATP synthase assembly protein I
VSQGNQDFDQASKLAGLVGQIGCVTGFVSILIIAVAFAVGRFLDSTFNTNGLFTVLFLLGSFPITLYVIVKISLLAVGRAQQSNKKIDSVSEEESAT